MKRKAVFTGLLVLGAALLGLAPPLQARIKLAALPERSRTLIRLDHPQATLIHEERVLTLQKGLNQVDFSWKGVDIDEDSIRLTLLSHRDRVSLLNLSYPPGESALVWEIHSRDACEAEVRISYLLSNIDRLTAYKAVADKDEKTLDFRSFLVLRNFSGEDFQGARLHVDGRRDFQASIRNGETRRMLLLKGGRIPMEKRWTFDAQKLPWDPEKMETDVGIPVTYRIANREEGGLGAFPLAGGKVRVFQEDGHGGTIFLGEDRMAFVPSGETADIYIGDSRDLVVTQRKMRERRVNIRRNQKNRIVLYDTDELIRATVRNFKDDPARLTMIQHIPGQWDMVECNMAYERTDAHTLKVEMTLPPRGEQELIMNYHRRNVRGGEESR